MVEGCRKLPSGMTLGDALRNRDAHLKTSAEHHDAAVRDAAGNRADELDDEIEAFAADLAAQLEGVTAP